VGAQRAATQRFRWPSSLSARAGPPRASAARPEALARDAGAAGERPPIRAPPPQRVLRQGATGARPRRLRVPWRPSEDLIRPPQPSGAKMTPPSDRRGAAATQEWKPRSLTPSSTARRDRRRGCAHRHTTEAGTGAGMIRVSIAARRLHYLLDAARRRLWGRASSGRPIASFMGSTDACDVRDHSPCEPRALSTSSARI
jgi:hypothetical protein